MEKLEVNLLELRILSRALYREIGLLRHEVGKINEKLSTQRLDAVNESSLYAFLDIVRSQLSTAEYLYVQVRELEDFLENQV